MVIIISNDVLNDLSMETRKRTVASICAKVVPLMFCDDINFKTFYSCNFNRRVIS